MVSGTFIKTFWCLSMSRCKLIPKSSQTCKSGQGLAQRGLVARLGMTAGLKGVFHYGFSGYQPVNPNTKFDMKIGSPKVQASPNIIKEI